jgi:hypothetical protein
MTRIAKPSDPKRIAELKKKIDSSLYLNKAVAGIASTLTHGLLQWNGVELEENDTAKKQRKRSQS